MAIDVQQHSTAVTAGQALLKAGLPAPLLPLVIGQLAVETAGFTSRVFSQYNNLSGIKYINKPYQVGATQGGPATDGGYFAKFDSTTSWAADFVRILKLDRAGAGAPIAATTLPDFVARLQANHYFGNDSAAHYQAGIAAQMNKFSTAIEAVKKKPL